MTHGTAVIIPAFNNFLEEDFVCGKWCLTQRPPTSLSAIEDGDLEVSGRGLSSWKVTATGGYSTSRRCPRC